MSELDNMQLRKLCTTTIESKEVQVMVNCTFSCCSWQHQTQSSNRILTFCEPQKVIPGDSKDLNSVIYKQMHVKTLLMCKPFLMSTGSIQKHTQTSNTNWWRVLPLLKTKQICSYTDYTHSYIITHPGTWHILLSIQSQNFNSLSTQHSNSKYAGFYTTLGLGHMFVTIFTRNVISSPSQRSTKQICRVPVKIV